MNKIEQFRITGMTISGFKSYEGPTELTFGDPTVITGGNGRGKTSIADAIAFAVTGLPFFGERGIDRLHNENNPDVSIQMRFVDERGAAHELTRTRRKNRMTISYDGYEIRQLDLTDLFGERDVFLSILNPLYFIEELGEDGKNLLERYLPHIPQETILAQLSESVRETLKDEFLLSPDAYLKRRREEIRGLEERITYLNGQKDMAVVSTISSIGLAMISALVSNSPDQDKAVRREIVESCTNEPTSCPTIIRVRVHLAVSPVSRYCCKKRKCKSRMPLRVPCRSHRSLQSSYYIHRENNDNRLLE